MKIFIGSSKESIDYMRQVAAIIESEGHEPLKWNKPGLFIAGQYTFESLENIAQKVDAALFIFNSDDKIWYRDQDIVGSVRDNVLIEYGLFCGNVSIMKSCICCANNPRIASDLNGITYIDLTNMSQAEIEIIEWLKYINNQPINKNFESANIQKSEILQVYESERLAANDICADAKDSKIMYVYTFTGNIFFDFRANEIPQLLRTKQGDIRFILLHPDSPDVEKRAREINQNAEEFVAQLNSAISTINNFQNNNIKLALTDELMRIKFHIFDNVIYLGFRIIGKVSAQTQMYRIGKDSYLYKALLEQFNDLWEKYYKCT